MPVYIRGLLYLHIFDSVSPLHSTPNLKSRVSSIHVVPDPDLDHDKAYSGKTTSCGEMVKGEEGSTNLLLSLKLLDGMIFFS